MSLTESPFGIWIILLAPLLAYASRVFFGRALGDRSALVSTAGIALSFLVSVILFFQMLYAHDPLWRQHFTFDWLAVGQFEIRMGFLLDNITAIMLVVVTMVSLLVHLFSMGYMKGDERYGRFFSFLSLFTFSMLFLVVTDNLIGLYIGWELVGLSSYLLIGFWFQKPSAASAAKKAFLTTRVGDVGMFIGILMLYHVTGTFQYDELFHLISKGVFTHLKVNVLGWFHVDYLTLAGLFFFCGAIGKSAQFPLHVWLPDAMEGPTPVSALIHAATMVAAGVYLVTRCYLVFTPTALLGVAYVGGFTALFAATIALTATDIKKVLAYSTVSQLGYMVLGLGVGGYTAGFFHLWTHAFFKALLFLGSGSVILGMHHEQDMRRMGGLRTRMPWTWRTMLIATLAISGVPLFSGFYSKDMILASALAKAMLDPSQWLLPTFGFCAAALTAFYMFRLMYMTFWGQPRWALAHADGGTPTGGGHGHDSGHDAGHGHEHHHAPDPAHMKHVDEDPVMKYPLIILAVMTLIAAGSPLSAHKWIEGYVQKPSMEMYEAGPRPVAIKPAASTAADPRAAHIAHVEHEAHGLAMIWSILIAACGIGLSTLTYYAGWISPEAWARRLSWLHHCLMNKWFFDELYEWTLVRPLLAINAFLARFDLEWIDGIVNGSAEFTIRFCAVAGWIDNRLVDGMVNETANTLLSSGRALSRFQSGMLRHYLAWAVVGMVMLAVALSVFF